MRLPLSLLLVLVVPGMAHAQPSGWSAATGASAPEAPAATIEITRPVNVPGTGDGVARPAPQGCEFKPVMSDEDYRRCGAKPPNDTVDFAGPWPPGKGAGRRRTGG